MNHLDLLMRMEDGENLEFEEYEALADWMEETGLVNTTGSYQRFVASIRGYQGGDW